MSDGTVTIHGKVYETVALRVQKLREAHPDWAILTTIIHRDADCVVMSAEIINADGFTLGTGHAEEYRNTSTINRTSALENCETSAIGRALAAAGYGGTEFATADELKRAIVDKQPAKPNTATQVMHDQYDAMNEEEKAFIDNLTADVTALLDEARDAEAWAMCTNGLQAEEQLALWSRLSKPNQKRLKAAKPTKEAA